MKKYFLISILAVAIIGSGTSFFYFKKDNPSQKVSGVIAEAEGESNGLDEQQIADNIEKYQPKTSERTENKGPAITAKSAVVFDQNTGEIIWQKNQDKELPPASIQKILTFSLALENHKPEDLLTVSDTAAKQISNKINLKKGEQLKASDFLYALMMISANDAAWVIAENTEGGFDGFINQMDRKTKSLGLKHSNFTNPAGLDDKKQYSSAFDLATLTRYALIEHPEVVRYAGKKKEHSVFATAHNEPHWWFGHLSHMLYSYKGMLAAKTGFTDAAKTTYIGIAQRGNKKIVIVFLGSSDGNSDAKKLLDFGFAN